MTLPEEYEYINGQHILLQQWVSKVNSNDHQNARCLIITDYEFFLFRKRIFRRVMEFSRKFEWKSLSSVNLSDEKLLTLKFKNGSLALKEKNVDEITQMIYKYVNAVWLPHEKEKPKFIVPSDFELPQQIGSIPLRIKFLKYTSGGVFPKRTAEALARFLATQPEEFQLNQIKNLIEYLPLFLESLEFEPNIKKLIIPLQSVRNSDRIIYEFLKKNVTVEELEFTENKTDNFNHILDALTKNKDSAVKKISFKNFQGLEPSDLDRFNKLINTNRITSIIFINTLSSLIANPYMYTIAANRGYKSVVTMILDGTPNLNIYPIFQYMRNLQTLSIAQCDVEIADVFNALKEFGSSSLKKINASNNISKLDMFPDCKIPANLYSFYLTGIVWSTNNLIKSIELILSHKPDPDVVGISPGVILNLSDARLPAGEWTNFFNSLNHMSGSDALEEFRWDRNPIGSILNLVDKCPQLTALSLNGCFGESESAEFGRLVKIVEEGTLTMLALEATDGRRLSSSDVDRLVGAVKSNRTLERLDIAGQGGGQVFLDRLASALLENRALEFLRLSGASLGGVRAFRHFFEMLAHRGTPLRVKWTKRELTAMARADDATEEEIAAFDEARAAVFEGNAEIVVRPEQRRLTKEEAELESKKGESLIELSDVSA